MGRSAWFEVHREGLGKLVEARGPEFMVYELVQNAWDQRVSEVVVTLEPVDGRALVRLAVEDDDPEGFTDLAHAYTLFADSSKKVDPSRRGRFNLGEKLVLARALEATVMTTTGGVRFDTDGRHPLRTKRARGSRVEAVVKMTRSELAGVLEKVRALLPPRNITTRINGEPLPVREPVREIEVRLDTLVADEEGVLRIRKRATVVRLYEPRSGETATLYELGIPVVETGDRWHCDVGQKVPLGMDRDNVPPAYLRALRTAVLNATSDLLAREDATSRWVREALSDKGCSDEAVRRAVQERFGERVVSYDPSDSEANKLAVSQGYAVVHGGQLGVEEWANVRRAGAILPAGRVTPSPKPFHPDGSPLAQVPEEAWTEGMRHVARYARRLAQGLLGAHIVVLYTRDRGWPCSAAYDCRTLCLNVGRLGHAWFEQGIREEVDALLLHEFAHHFSADHLSAEYHEALCTLGAKLKRLAGLEHEVA